MARVLRSADPENGWHLALLVIVVLSLILIHDYYFPYKEVCVKPHYHVEQSNK